MSSTGRDLWRSEENVHPQCPLYSVWHDHRGSTEECPAVFIPADRVEATLELDVRKWSTLDDYIVEKIIARLPFKSLFQASLMSKQWRLKFRSPSFQSEVCNRSVASLWESYAPVFVNHMNDLVGYGRRSKRWHKLPTHSYLQQGVVVQDWVLRAGTGSIFCWTGPCAFNGYGPDGDRRAHIHVTNPFVQSWKQLPPRPRMGGPRQGGPRQGDPQLVHVDCEEGMQSYQVIVATAEEQLDGHRFYVQILDSAEDTWTVMEYPETRLISKHKCTSLLGSAFVNGVVYMVVFTYELRSVYTLFSFDVQKKIWEQKGLQMPDIWSRRLLFDDNYKSQVAVCGSNVMHVVIHNERITYEDFVVHGSTDDEESTYETVSVFRLDLEQGLTLEVAKAPNEMLSAVGVGIVGHGDCIHIGNSDPSSPSVLYNVRTEQWEWVKSAAVDSPLSFSGTPANEWQWKSVAYQPGLNPFLEV